MSVRVLIRIVSDWRVQSGVKVAGGAGDASRHRQTAAAAPALSNVRISDPGFPAPAATVERGKPASPRASSSLCAGWRWLTRANARLEDSWLGDALGAACLFAILWMLLFLGLIFE